MICVIGSSNMDLVLVVDRIPNRGETIIGKDLFYNPGGKGANQAVAISKLDSKIVFLSKVGNDDFGEKIIFSLDNSGVDTSQIEKSDKATGLAVINVDRNANNNIVVIPGANLKIDKKYIERNIDIIKESNIVLFQLEIPIETVRHALKISKKLGKITVLNPAPAIELDSEIIENVDILIPNEHELEIMTKIKTDTNESIIKASKVLLEKGVKELIVTLGKKGVMHINSKEEKFYNAIKVNAVDTTAAGDSFIGAFVSSYENDNNIEKAINFAQKAASITVTRIGAQSSLPNIEELKLNR